MLSTWSSVSAIAIGIRAALAGLPFLILLITNYQQFSMAPGFVIIWEAFTVVACVVGMALVLWGVLHLTGALSHSQLLPITMIGIGLLSLATTGYFVLVVLANQHILFLPQWALVEQIQYGLLPPLVFGSLIYMFVNPALLRRVTSIAAGVVAFYAACQLVKSGWLVLNIKHLSFFWLPVIAALCAAAILLFLRKCPSWMCWALAGAAAIAGTEWSYYLVMEYSTRGDDVRPDTAIRLYHNARAFLEWSSVSVSIVFLVRAAASANATSQTVENTKGTGGTGVIV